MTKVKFAVLQVVGDREFRTTLTLLAPVIVYLLPWPRLSGLVTSRQVALLCAQKCLDRIGHHRAFSDAELAPIESCPTRDFRLGRKAESIRGLARQARTMGKRYTCSRVIKSQNSNKDQDMLYIRTTVPGSSHGVDQLLS